jgi:outer membrane protein OmpA-like peptidoglycan-associated protein
MRKVITLLSFAALVYLNSLPLQAQSECAKRSLFSPMPNHEESSCELKDFDSHTFYKSKAGGAYETLPKEGNKMVVRYNWLGDWEKRPSVTQIYKNYQAAVEKQGGQLLYSSGSYYHFQLNQAGDQYFIEVLSDGSGMYTVTTLKVNTMKQDVVFTAKEIDQSISRDGQLTFYGIYFDVNKAVLKPESTGSIREIATFLKSHNNKQVYLVGHTDNSGTYDHNLKLSKDRAQAVVNELINQYGVASTQVSAQGVGDLCPVANNQTEEGKAKNRRVVMVLKK